VAVFLSGRPLWVNPEINASDAFVAAWLPGSEGGGVADVLFKSPGKRSEDFSGRLAFSWPLTAMPVTFDSSGAVSGALFARGYGLDYESKAQSPALSEAPAIPERWRAPSGSLFYAGHATAPWSIFVADGVDEVHLSTTRQSSPNGTVVAGLESAAGTVAASWNGAGAGTLRFSGRPIDLGTAATQGAAIEVRYRVDRLPEGSVKVGVSPGAMLDFTQTFKSSVLGEWRTLSVPLSCLKSQGADLREVAIPLAIETAGRFTVSILAARVTARGVIPIAPCENGASR
jgi:beta-glucosidase